MVNRKATFVTTGVVALASVALLGIAAPQAHAGSIWDTLAQKFGIKKEQVQQNWMQHRQENQAERLQRLADHLDQAVKDGKLTAQQKDVILTKAKEMQAFHDSLKDKPPQERRAALKLKHDELVQWASDNNIPAPFALGGHIQHLRMHRMMH